MRLPRLVPGSTGTRCRQPRCGAGSRPTDVPAPRSPSLSRAVPCDLHGPRLEPRPLHLAHQHDMGRFVEHRPHHLVAAPRYRAASVDLARLIPGRRQTKHRPDGLGVPEAGGHVNGSAIGQRHHRADIRHRRRHTSSVRRDPEQIGILHGRLLAVVRQPRLHCRTAHDMAGTAAARLAAATCNLRLVRRRVSPWNIDRVWIS
jgi:hypothetical protein